MTSYTFKELLDEHASDKALILNRIEMLYSDQEQNRENYLEVIRTLLALEPEVNDMVINIAHRVEEYTDETDEWEDVYGTNGETHGPDHEIHWALEFSSWSKWLGMKISPVTALGYNEIDILAHLLWEMTFMGFDEETIQKEAEMIQERKLEAQEMIADANTTKT